MMSIRLPFWLRVVALVGVTVLVTGAGLRISILYPSGNAHRGCRLADGEAAKAMSAIAGELVSINAGVRLKIFRHR